MMYYAKNSFTFLLLLFGASVGIVNAQSDLGSEKNFIERVYDKFSLYQTAQKRHNLDKKGEPAKDEDLLRFTIYNVNSGPISEIRNQPVTNLVTLPSGKILDSVRVETNYTEFEQGRRKNKTEKFGIDVKWVDGQYASVTDPQITVGEALNLYADRFPNITRYISYMVTVMFEGKARTYNALVFLQQPIGNRQKPYFVDNIASFGGILNELVELEKTPVDTKKEVSNYTRNLPVKYLNASFKDASNVAPLKTNRLNSCTPYETVSGLQDKNTLNEDGHNSGSHGLKTKFLPYCKVTSTCQTTCELQRFGEDTYENGTVSSLIYYHGLSTTTRTNDASGTGAGTITCSSLHGVAVRSCTFLGCSGSITITGSGGSATVTGGDVWNGTHNPTHSCTATATSGGVTGGCNQSPPCALGFVNSGGICTRSLQFQSRCLGMGYEEGSCSCPDGMGNSPIIIDVDGSGFSLTNAANGVIFDIQDLDFPQRLGWTASGSTNAFLVLDRNNNGTIDSGSELFGNVTPQPQSDHQNGFIALAEYDKTENGGNNDGEITAQDSIFNSLRLWQDANHNGVSEANELKTLPSLGVRKMELDYKESKRTDNHGNQFKYRAKVKDTKGNNVGRWAWDVFLVSEP